MFHLRTQRPGKFVTTFARTLYELADGCNFVNENEEIKNRLFSGLQDKGQSVRLQLTSELKFNKALEMAKSYEQIKTLMEETQTKTVDEVRTKRRNFSNALKPKPEDCSQCPPKGQTSQKYNCFNHFTICCKTKISNVREIKHNNKEEYFSC